MKKQGLLIQLIDFFLNFAIDINNATIIWEMIQKI